MNLLVCMLVFVFDCRILTFLFTHVLVWVRVRESDCHMDNIACVCVGVGMGREGGGGGGGGRRGKY